MKLASTRLIYFIGFTFFTLITLVNCEHEPFEPIEPDVTIDTGGILDTTNIGDTSTTDTTQQDTTMNDSTMIPSFSSDVKPIIDANCATSGCHVSGAQFPPLTSYNEIKDKSSRVKSRTGAGTMPPQGSLSAEQIETIANWVDGGTPNN